MRILRFVALLIVIFTSAAVLSQVSTAPQRDIKDAPRFSYQIAAAMPQDMSVRFSEVRTHRIQFVDSEMGTCYFIRSYEQKRIDGTDITVPGKMTTCTPASRFQMKKAVRAVPADQR